MGSTNISHRGTVFVLRVLNNQGTDHVGFVTTGVMVYCAETDIRGFLRGKRLVPTAFYVQGQPKCGFNVTGIFVRFVSTFVKKILRNLITLLLLDV